MHILSLLLNNFRNYNEKKIEFHPHVNIVMGMNAQGKSNLLEAIHYLSIFSSFRNSKDREMIKWGQSYFYLEGKIVKNNGEYLLSAGYHEENKKILKVNGSQRKKIRDLLGVFNSVVFSPEDLNIIKNGPSARRRFLDQEMIQLFPSYYHALIQYQKILGQRNNLLREIRIHKKKDDLLPIWSQQLLQHGSKIIKKRFEVLKKLTPLARLTHRKITNGAEELDLNYYSLEMGREENLKTASLEKIQNIYFTQLEKFRSLEMERGITLIGPHRDDLIITINGIDARKFGSQGQQRTAALSLKIAELELVKSEIGEYPVLLLDDVMSELDQTRRNHLMQYIGNKVQTFITTTDFDFKQKEGNLIQISQGEIENKKI
ncbi:MAG: DNA replication/repair protein RecF [Christensenellales bacterium]